MLQLEFRQISGRSAKKRLSERAERGEREKIIKKTLGEPLAQRRERCDLFAPEKANISEMILPRRMNATHDYLLLRDRAARI
jgi:hypothetical protein